MLTPSVLVGAVLLYQMTVLDNNLASEIIQGIVGLGLLYIAAATYRGNKKTDQIKAHLSTQDVAMERNADVASAELEGARSSVTDRVSDVHDELRTTNNHTVGELIEQNMPPSTGDQVATLDPRPDQSTAANPTPVTTKDEAEPHKPPNPNEA